MQFVLLTFNSLLRMKKLFLLFSLLSICLLANAQVNLNSGLVAYYPFNGSFADATGNGNTGIPFGGVTFVADQFGNANSAISFNGTNGWVSIPSSVKHTPGSHFSIAFRFRTNSANGQYLMSKSVYSGLPSDFQYDLGFNLGSLTGTGLFWATNHTNGCAYSGNFAQDIAYSGTSILPNQWYCVVMTFDSSLKKIYVNGALASQTNVTVGTPNIIDSCILGTLRLGTWWQNDPQYFDGNMDEIRLYKRQLTTQEIAALCNTFMQPSKTINDYAAVESYLPCNNTLVVDTSVKFKTGDTILVIQMKGAVIDSSNTASFGNVTALNNAGNYEYNIIKSKLGKSLKLKYKLLKNYDFPKGNVQIVRVPYYQNYTVSQAHTCAPWNGKKGGVFAVNVANRITINDRIDVSEKGFQGAIGNPFSSNNSYCNVTDYYAYANQDSSNFKGEGIATISVFKQMGRGKLSNGGGGGNGHNSGGGGGSNGGTGGFGGYQFEGCVASPATNITGGIGGESLNYSNANNKIYLGGGGGAGQSNTVTNTTGGNGGGIVIITADSIGGTGYIMSNGGGGIECTSLGGNTCHDGMGGGGGGGTILLNANKFGGSVTVMANGGKGADELGSSTNQQVGPGGGGGGGVLWLKSASTPSSIASSYLGGTNGIVMYNSNAWGATSGQAGQALYNLQIVTPTDTFANVIQPAFTDSVVACNTYKFTDKSIVTTGGHTVFWDFGDGTSTNQSSPTHFYPVKGTYTVKLFVYENGGACNDSVIKQITIKNFDYKITDTATACKTIKFTGLKLSGQTATSYTWLFGDNQSDTTNPAVHQYAVGGSYAVKLILSDLTGCIDTVNYGIFVDEVRASFTASKDTICQGDIITFSNASSANAITYFWDFGDGNTALNINPNHSYINSGLYHPYLVVTNASGCKDTFRRVILVDSITTVDFVTNGDNLCEGQQIIFNAQYYGGGSTGFDWSFGDGSILSGKNPISHAFDTADVFNIGLTVHFRACPDASTTKNVTINPFPRIDLGHDTSMCPGVVGFMLADVNNMGNPDAIWRWNTGATSSSIFVGHPGIYTVNVSLKGCDANDTIEIFKDCYIDIPNAFTPNGDGTNDFFIPRNLFTRGITSFEMKIYDRWGILMFETTKLDGRGWDGKYNGADQPMGVYVYLITVDMKSGESEKYKGNVTLMR